jgi:hypothetical protein
MKHTNALRGHNAEFITLKHTVHVWVVALALKGWVLTKRKCIQNYFLKEGNLCNDCVVTETMKRKRTQCEESKQAFGSLLLPEWRRNDRSDNTLAQYIHEINYAFQYFAMPYFHSLEKSNFMLTILYKFWFRIKHNRSLIVAIQGPDFGPLLIHTWFHIIVKVLVVIKTSISPRTSELKVYCNLPP